MREHGMSGAPIGALATAATLFLELHNMTEAGQVLDVRHIASTPGDVAAASACVDKSSKDSCARCSQPRPFCTCLLQKKRLFAPGKPATAAMEQWLNDGAK